VSLGSILRARRARGLAPAPFIVGTTRSGSTLLRLMLDAHPALAIPSETHFVPDVIAACEERDPTPEELCRVFTTHRRWGDFHLEGDELLGRLRALPRLRAGDAIRAFFELYASHQGKPRWGDKTPGYSRHMPAIERVLPETRFIHLIRDGRDVALSVLPLSWGPDNVERAAERWVKRIGKARRDARRVAHYTEIRYEDLILDTEPALRRVCEFIELDFDPAMLRYHERAEERLQEKARDLTRRDGSVQPADARMRSHDLATEPPRADRVARWRSKMSPTDVAAYERIAGDLLSDLGYPSGSAART
jgi:hypothetical protein